MRSVLFPRLTPRSERGAAGFAAATAIARTPAFYHHGQVSDTIDGRFALLATVVALLLVRIERDGDAGNAVSVALTERFIAAMEAEHREFGLGDPALGKTVRKLVGALARRVELWRSAVTEQLEWGEATNSSVYGGKTDVAGVKFVAAQLRLLWSRFVATDLSAIERGQWQ